ANNDKELMLAVMRPATSSGAGGLASHPVSTAVNSVRNNGPSLIEPLGDAEPPGSSLFLPLFPTEDPPWKSALPVSGLRKCAPTWTERFRCSRVNTTLSGAAARRRATLVRT